MSDTHHGIKMRRNKRVTADLCEAEEFVRDHPGAEHKSFPTYEEAMVYVYGKAGARKRIEDEKINKLDHDLFWDIQRLFKINQERDAAEQKLASVYQEITCAEQVCIASKERFNAAEQQWLAAKRQRIAYKEQRLAAEQQRLAAEQQRLTAEQQQLVAERTAASENEALRKCLIEAASSIHTVVDDSLRPNAE